MNDHGDQEHARKSPPATGELFSSAGGGRPRLHDLTWGMARLGEDGIDTAFARSILEVGVGQVDTSNAYAAGRSESSLGLALSELVGTKRPVVFTKADRDPVSGRYDRDRVLRSAEESLKRLGVDSFGIFHLHDPDVIPFEEAVAPGGAVEGMIELREQGVARSIGVAQGDVAVAEQFLRTDVFDAFLTHNRWTLLSREAEAVLDLAAEKMMTVFNAAPFGGGYLAGSTARGVTHGYTQLSAAQVRYLGRLRELVDEAGVSMKSAALAFSTRDPRIDSTVVGVGSAGQVRELLSIAATPIPDGFWSDLAELGSPPYSDESHPRATAI